MNHQFLQKEYFPNKYYLNSTANASKFDVVVNESRCKKFQKEGKLCDKCFNDTLIDKMQKLSSLERLDFVNYQLNLYEDPVDYLKRLYAFLNDNVDNFDSIYYSVAHELQQIALDGIKQLTKNERNEKPKTTNIQEFISQDRIEELEKIKSMEYDLTRLITIINEINIAFENCSYISVIMLTRALIDHIPPIFGYPDFRSVYGQYGTKSFKEHMRHLDTSMRKIADSYLHTHIRKKESVPTITQVNFSQDIDVLIAEIIRKMNE